MRKILSVLIALTMLCSLIIPAVTVTAADELIGTDSMKVVGRRVGEQYQVSVYLYTTREAAGVTFKMHSAGGLNPNMITNDKGREVQNIQVNTAVEFNPAVNMIYRNGSIGFNYVADGHGATGDEGTVLNGELFATYTYDITGDRDEASFFPDADAPMYVGVFDYDTNTFPKYDFGNIVYDLEPLKAPDTEEPDTTVPPVSDTEEPQPDTTAPVTETEEPQPDTTTPTPTETEEPDTTTPDTDREPDNDDFTEHTVYAKGEVVDGKYVVKVFQYQSPGVAGYYLSLDYNTAALVLKEATAGEVIPNNDNTPFVTSDYTKTLEDGTEVPVVPFNATQLNDNADSTERYGNGLLLTYVFDILDQDADHQIQIQPKEGWWFTDSDFSAESIPAVKTNFKWFEETDEPQPDTTAPTPTETEEPDTTAPETEPKPPVFDEFTAYIVGTVEGNKLTVVVNLYENPGIGGFWFSAGYNSDVVKLTGYTKGDVYPAAKVFPGLLTGNPFTIMGNDEELDEEGWFVNFYSNDGVLVTYEFEILDPNGDPEFKFEALEGAWWADKYGDTEAFPNIVTNIPLGPKPPVTETEEPQPDTTVPPVTETEEPQPDTTVPPVTETDEPQPDTTVPPVTETDKPQPDTTVPPVTETDEPQPDTTVPPVTETDEPVTDKPGTEPVTEPTSGSESESAAASKPASDSDTTKDTAKAPATTAPDNKDDAPQTGDKMMLIVIVMAVAVVSCGVVIVVRRKITSK